MRCPSVLRLIDDHVDGLLPALEAEQVRDHLDDCRDCRETAAASKAASTSLKAWGDLEPPSQCLDAIWDKIQALPPDALARPPRVRPPERPLARLVRFSIPAAAAAAVICGFVVTGNLHRPAPSSRGGRPAVASAQSGSSVLPSAMSTASSDVLKLLPGEERAQRFQLNDSEIEPGIRHNGPQVPWVPVDFRFRTPR